MIWLFLQLVTITLLCVNAKDSSINTIIYLSVWLIWFALRELIGVIEKRRKR